MITPTSTKKISSISKSLSPSSQLIPCLLLCLLLTSCAPQPDPSAREITSFRDIPGITKQEIAAIEYMQGRTFIYGSTLGTKTFYLGSEIAGYSSLFCAWLTDLFGIHFELKIYTPESLEYRLENKMVDFAGAAYLQADGRNGESKILTTGTLIPYTDLVLCTKNPTLAPIISAVQKYVKNDADHKAAYQLISLYNQGEKEYRRRQFLNHLTEEEQNYIQVHQDLGAIIPIATRYDNYPISFYNKEEKQWEGISIDILKEIEDLTGMTFHNANKKTDAWFVIADMLEKGQVSMVDEFGFSEERKGRFLWADMPYQKDHYALVSKNSYKDVSLNEVAYSRVGLLANSLYSEEFFQMFPHETNTSEYITIEDGISALERGEIDLMMMTTNLLLMVSNYEEKTGFKINLVLKPHESYFCFNVNEPILRSVVSKAQVFVNTEKIVDRWIHRVFDYQSKVDRMWAWSFWGILFFVIAGIFMNTLGKNKQQRKHLESLVHKRTAELEVQTKLAKAASVAKSQFLASMSHEIRTPMNAIIGMSDLMRTDNLDEVQRNYFSDIKKMAKSLLSIINDILDFTKIEAGKMELVPVHYNIFGLFNNIVSISEYTASVKSLDFRSSFDKSIPEAIFGDEIRLREIIINIVNNAIKYTREGSVSLDMKKIVKDGKNFLEVTVTDTGIGIKQEDFPKLFGIFQQLDQEKNQGIVGTGLGLSITKNLVTMMDGKITFDSVYGEGTTFVITLPIIQGDPAKIEQKGIVDRVTAKEDVRILVVDDNSINITVALGFLATHNIFPDTATSGATAVKMVKAKAEQGCPYDLVFMDHMMPGMDGAEATKLIRAMGGGYEAMPIVALSANAVTGALEIFLEAGMNDFISKPIESQKLNAILLKWLPPEKITTKKENENEKESKMEKDSENDKLFEELNAIEGLDTAAGLSHVADNKTAYLQILRQFCAEFDGYIADIVQFWEAKNWDEYRIRVHAMKGVFANIGVEAISKWAYKLEMAAREKNAELCQAETNPLCEAMHQFKEKLDKTALVKPEEAREKRQVEAAALKDLIAKIAEAGKHGNVGTADKLAEELAGVKYSEAVDPLLTDLHDLLMSLDYGEAVEKVAEIAGVIGNA